MKTQFCIIRYFDPYGDKKSTRKESSRENFESSKPMSEVQQLVSNYNSTADYYSEIIITSVDRRIKSFRDFDTHYYSKSKASKTEYVDIPGL